MKKSSIQSTILLFICMASFLPLRTWASSKMGTESGGGGGIIWPDSTHPMLIDFFTIIKSIDELPRTAIEKPSFIESATILPLVITKENQRAFKANNTAFAAAMGTLEIWQKLPIDTMSFVVLEAFREPLKWSFTNDNLKAPPFYMAEKLPSNASIEVAAYYFKSSPKEFSVSISRKIWNQMTLINQAALLIHETLRQVQIGFGNDYNDESLQRSTAIYSLCKPTGRLNYYMFYLLNNSPEAADYVYGSFDTFIEKECKRIE